MPVGLPIPVMAMVYVMKMVSAVVKMAIMVPLVKMNVLVGPPIPVMVTEAVIPKASAFAILIIAAIPAI